MNLARASGMLALLVASASVRATDSAPPAAALVERTLAARHTTGFRAHTQLVITHTNQTSCQLLVKGRRADGVFQIAWLCRWPPPYKGCAVVLTRSANGEVGGFRFELPDRVEPLAEDDLAQPLFDSGFFIEDGLDDYWSWPAERLFGTMNLLGHACSGVVFRRPSGAGACTRVEAWIADDIAVPLRIDKFAADGSRIRRFDILKVARGGASHWSPVSIEITGTNATARTLWNNIRGERDIRVDPAEFTPEGLREALAPASSAGE